MHDRVTRDSSSNCKKAVEQEHKRSAELKAERAEWRRQELVSKKFLKSKGNGGQQKGEQPASCGADQIENTSIRTGLCKRK